MIYEDGLLRQCFYRHHSYPDFLVMREEFGIPCDGSFILYIFRVSGNELIVISCIQYSRTETTEFNSGYTYIRFPAVPDQPEEWEYQVSDEVRVACRSVRYITTIDGMPREVLEVRRDMYYTDHRIKSKVSSTTEYYPEGITGH